MTQHLPSFDNWSQLNFAMKKVFLDNNTYINAFEKKNEPACSKVAEILSQSDVELVLSEELLVEFAQTDNQLAAEHLLNSALQNKCIWIESFVQIQQREVGNYVRSTLLKVDVLPIRPFAERYDLLSEDSHPLVQPLDFLRACMVAEQQKEMAESHRLHADYLRELQLAKKQGRFTPEKEKQALFSLICSRIPLEVVRQAELMSFSFEDIVEHCMRSQKAMYRACPSMNSERYLSDYRASDHTRITRPSDSKDLTMSVAVLPYVDVFVSGDGYLYEGLQYVIKRVPAIKALMLRY